MASLVGSRVERKEDKNFLPEKEDIPLILTLLIRPMHILSDLHMQGLVFQKLMFPKLPMHLAW